MSPANETSLLTLALLLQYNNRIQLTKFSIPTGKNNKKKPLKRTVDQTQLRNNKTNQNQT